MKIWTAVGAALVATAINSLPAMASAYIGTPESAATRYSLAAQTQSAYQPVKIARRIAATQILDQNLYAIEYGDTLPPVGFVNFCTTNTDACLDYSWGDKLAPQKLKMSAATWKLIYRINTGANSKIKPVSDQALYGKPEVWAYPKNAGDCEDYALLKKRELQQLGLPAKTLQITVVLDENNEGHAVLTLATDHGDYVLDNRRDDIRLWNDTNYTFLKRQSVWNPRRWVALLDKSRTATTVATARRR